jgi:uncharacterized membrane-anchored protein YitT (DUF2179 family)
MKQSFQAYATVILGSLFIAISTNWFLIPSKLIGGGVSGLAMVIGFNFHWNISTLFFIFNIPLIIWGWKVMGLTFMNLSIISILTTTLFMFLIPIQLSPLYENIDLSIAAIFGGVFAGIGVGLSLRVGGSSGGFDILGAILTHKYDIPISQFLLALNGVVLLLYGWSTDWTMVMWSIVSEYVAVKVIAYIHIRHMKVTALIVSNYAEKLIPPLLTLQRGITILDSKGAYTDSKQKLLMTVTTRYELPFLKRIIRSTDPKAFVNIVETSEIYGSFRKETTR